ncbi:uncharacterized protein RHOBADRAFT_54448 [Rhodotorula graminis WP1]|uniref:Uncharacterized protein n=1 Tax=Rhodotorula graminis (strain WP1) TaxID=578459 RepID=A0A0P9ENY4_RHOGW|nr:uncharacterized protein RHOBADRAFT_54448 [Rhodotorula graminis WP1]KPV73854.1 hypothetical protein RHOBADRAFT_54448 [Rhodotorula graminis WP1]
MPLAWQMGAKTWQHPEVHQRWVEEEKARAAAAKVAREEAKLAKEVGKEQRQLIRRQLVDQTRQQREDKKDEYLAKLKADVVRLEMKRTGDTPDKRIALHDKAHASKHVEEREKVVGKEIKWSALEMLAIREKELDEKKKEQEKHLADLADRRRRELLEYKHALGLSSSAPRPPHRPTTLANRPLSLLDDPAFWRLDDANRHLLELMRPDERAEYGFGPYEEDEVEAGAAAQQHPSLPGAVPRIKEDQLARQIKSFTFTADPNPTTLVSAADAPITLSLPVDGLPDLSTLTADDRRTAQLIVEDESKRLRDELAMFAIDEFGANALVEFDESGLVHVEGEELLRAGYVYELRAQGVPAVLSHAPRPAPHHPQPARYAHFTAPARPAAAPSPWGTLGGSLGGLGGGNGGAGWDDEPLFGGPAPGAAAWGAPAGRGGAGWAVPGVRHGAGALPGAWGGGGGGAVWHGLSERPTAGFSAFPPPDPHHGAPPELRHLPWGAQQYVKAVRERREREERELAAAGAADVYHDAHPHPHLRPQPQPVHNPSLLQPNLARSSHVLSPHAPALAPVAARSAALHRELEMQPATVDPDDGGGGGGALGLGGVRAGLAAPVAMAPAPAPAAASKGWGGLKSWLTGGGGGGTGGAGAATVGPAATVGQGGAGGAGAGADLRAGQAW